MKQNKQAGIYALINHYDNDKVFVGATQNINTIEDRLIQKLNHGEHRNSRLQAAWDEYGVECFDIEILELVDGDVEKLKETKNKYITMYQSWDASRGYNLKKPKDATEIDISKHILGYKGDQSIATSEERVESISHMDDDVKIVEWLSSPGYRQSQVKGKNALLAENDKPTRALDQVAYWLLEPDRDEWGILSNNALANKGKGKKDENGKRNSFIRVLPFSALERTDDEGNAYYAAALDESVTMRDNSDVDIDILDWVDLANPKHIMELLKLSNVLEPTEDSGLETLLFLLEDILDLAGLDELDSFIVDCLRSRYALEDDKGYYVERAYTYKEIHQMALDKGFDCTYRKLEYRINKGIPNKLVEAYRELYDGAIKVMEQHKKNEKENVCVSWANEDAKNKNKEIKKKYNEFVATQPVSVEFWSKDEIKRYLSDTYGQKN